LNSANLLITVALQPLNAPRILAALYRRYHAECYRQFTRIPAILQNKCFGTKSGHLLQETVLFSFALF
jgi:hypothetical protein